MSRRDEIISLATKYREPHERARRIFLEEPSFALTTKKEFEFEIKSRISAHFNVQFRSIVFCGSAHLGFSPHKDTEFVPGASDLDVAIIDMGTFQSVWMLLVEATRAFTDLSGFRTFPNPDKIIEEVRGMMVRRGLIHLASMPTSRKLDYHRIFFDQLSKPYREVFSKINVTFYMNEYAFCWKQNSALVTLLRA